MRVPCWSFLSSVLTGRHDNTIHFGPLVNPGSCQAAQLQIGFKVLALGTPIRASNLWPTLLVCMLRTNALKGCPTQSGPLEIQARRSPTSKSSRSQARLGQTLPWLSSSNAGEKSYRSVGSTKAGGHYTSAFRDLNF